jgi:diguanylate cyclase (GGDEF)-like protein
MTFGLWIALIMSWFGIGGFALDRRRLVDENRALRDKVEKLKELSFTDELTGIGNRRLFAEHLAVQVPHAIRARESLALLALDLNALKWVNDSLGHEAGDRMIATLAKALRDSVRPTDTVCRVGGDEFNVLLPSCDLAGLQVVAERLVINLAKTHAILGERAIPVRVSIGGTVLTVAADRVMVGGLDVGHTMSRSTVAASSEQLCSKADGLLYEAKTRKGTEDYPVALH